MPTGSDVSLNSEMEPNTFFLTMPAQCHLSSIEASSASPRTSCCPRYPHKAAVEGPRVVFPPLGAAADGSVG